MKFCLVYAIMKSKGAQVRHRWRKEKNMNCPYCNKEMEKGYVEQTGVLHPLEWYSEHRDGDFLWSKRKHVKLTTATTPLTMYYCEPCGKFIAEVSKE